MQILFQINPVPLYHHIDHPILSVWGGHIGYTVRPNERYFLLTLRANFIPNQSNTALSPRRPPRQYSHILRRLRELFSRWRDYPGRR